MIHLFFLILNMLQLQTYAVLPILFNITNTKYHFANYTPACLQEKGMIPFSYDMIDAANTWIEETNKNIFNCNIEKHRDFNLSLIKSENDYDILNIVDDSCQLAVPLGPKTNLNENTVGGLGMYLINNKKHDSLDIIFNLPWPGHGNQYPPGYASNSNGVISIHNNIYIRDIVLDLTHELGHVLGFKHTRTIDRNYDFSNPMSVTPYDKRYRCYTSPHALQLGMISPRNVYLLENINNFTFYVPRYNDTDGGTIMIMGENSDIYINKRDIQSYASAYLSTFRYQYECQFYNGIDINIDCDIDKGVSNFNIVYSWETTYVYEFVTPDNDILIDIDGKQIRLTYFDENLINLSVI